MTTLGTPLSPTATRVLFCGGGELGKEVVIELQRLGVEVIVVDRYADAPGMQVAHRSHVISMLDGEALRTARKGARGRAFVKALSTLCGELGVDIIAEMIDDQEGLNFIKSCGIDYAQGYFFGKPSMDITVFEDRHRKRRSG